MRCPHCDDPIDDGSVVCPNCNKDVRPVSPTPTSASVTTSRAIKQCPFCAEEILEKAIVCKHCSHDLRTGAAPGQTVVIQSGDQRLWSPGVAAVLSLVIPGAGQMYKGEIGGGIAWLVFIVIGYVMFVFPGLILHLVCIVNAASGNPSPKNQAAAATHPSRSLVPSSGHFGCPSCFKTVRAGASKCPHCGAAFVATS